MPPKLNWLDFSESSAGLAIVKVLTWQSSSPGLSTAQDAGSTTLSAENVVFWVRIGRLGARKPLPTEPRSDSVGSGFHFRPSFGEKSLP